MPDDFALRAYRSDIDNLRTNAARAVADVRRHVDAVDVWLGGGPAPAPLPNLGTDVAQLIAAASALKALLDAAYLTEEN